MYHIFSIVSDDMSVNSNVEPSLKMTIFEVSVQSICIMYVMIKLDSLVHLFLYPISLHT